MSIFSVAIAILIATFLLFLSWDRDRQKIEEFKRYQLISITFLSNLQQSPNEEKLHKSYKNLLVFLLPKSETKKLKKEIEKNGKTVFSGGSTSGKVRVFELNKKHYIYVQRMGYNLMFKDNKPKNYNFEYALILSGDQLYQMDYKLMLKEHVANKAEISIATIPVNAKDATSFGILKSDENNVITSFIEKPEAKLLPDWTSDVSDEMKSAGRHYLASMGIYIFNRKLLVELMNDPSTNDFGKEIIPQNIDKHKTLSYQFEGYWTDIGNIDSFFEANIGLTDSIPKFDLYSNNKRVYTRARILPTTKISGTTLNSSVIADGCIISAAKIERSVIGIRSRIGDESTVINTYMMGSDFYETLEEIESRKISVLMGIGQRCFIKNAIIDKNCRIGDDVRINGGKHLEDVETDLYVVRDGIVVVKKGVTIPHGYII